MIAWDAVEKELLNPSMSTTEVETPNYRVFVGPDEKHDRASALQFNLLTWLGLEEHHYLLDVGCGSLRAGRLLIPYLLPGRYFGIDPAQWLIDEGIENEVGKDLVRIRRPTFSNDANFTLSRFERDFDFVLAQSISVMLHQRKLRNV